MEVEGYSCDDGEPHACYKGDMSGKHGPLEAGVSGAAVTFTDLSFSVAEVLGHSVVVHAADGGAPRIACATILAGAESTVVTEAHAVVDGGAVLGLLTFSSSIRRSCSGICSSGPSTSSTASSRGLFRLH